MIGTLVIIALFVSGAIYSMIYPVLLPDIVITAITNLLTPIFAFNFIFPIQAIFSCLNWAIQILVLYMVYRLIMGAVGLINGSGHPDLE